MAGLGASWRVPTIKRDTSLLPEWAKQLIPEGVYDATIIDAKSSQGTIYAYVRYKFRIDGTELIVFYVNAPGATLYTKRLADTFGLAQNEQDIPLCIGRRFRIRIKHRQSYQGQSWFNDVNLIEELPPK